MWRSKWNININKKQQHYISLKQFTSDNGLKPTRDIQSKPTYFHTDGKATSQIDYILSNNDILLSTSIYCQDPVNTSTHVPVKACTNVYLKINKNSKFKANSVAYKLIWEEMDKDIYINEIDKHLQYLPSVETTIDDKMCHGNSTQSYQTSSTIKNYQTKWTKRKASPDVKRLMGISKNKHRLWNDTERPRDDHPLFKDKKEVKRNLRKQQRKETALEKEQFIQKLEENPNDQIFHQLIRSNRSETSKSATDFLKMGEEEAIFKKEQCELLAKYFEDLAQPKDNVDFNNEKLLNCKKRCKIIKKIAKASSDTEVTITKEDIRKAINQLKVKKAADDYDLESEHLKHSGESLLEILQETFNQILLEEKVPSTFKTGTVSPILKKGKTFYSMR
ncbi:Hypothetical predicted protein [Mytilus galloprovincialis]|uniref:Endonuclease/exonuclease/phosphatase domain-containing protein n=1 Tax=Mytilus galloprovincialis TaxID=29158 RepID=A0A8B6C1L6_MYTGA|nr:Hypothetical predicted protein [Mytilus galloprovincialis]